MDGVATTPSLYHLFKTRNNVPKLNKERADLFHRVTVQILVVVHRDRPDLQTAISFLPKKVVEDTTDKDKYKKLARAATCIHGTKFLHLTIKAAYLG
jgi:hypothetical protein